MEEWKEYKLGEVINILDYKRIPLSSAERKTREGGFPYYGAQGIIDYIDDYIFDGTYLLIAEDGENLKSKKQDIAQLAHGKYWVNNHAHIVESNGICDIRYLCYILNNIDLSGYITGSAQPKLNQANLSAISIILPPLNLQEQITDFISIFDDRIELNRRINDNLEQQAQALFKSWFVDFEPFKDGKFVDSELGMIPEGWRVGNLLDIAKLYDAKRKPLSSRERENMKKIYPYYGATSIMDYVDKYIFDGTYLLMGEDGSVMDDKGYPYLQYIFGKFWSNNHAHVMQGKNNFSTEMLHCLLLKKNISPIVTGAVQAKISQANMRKILITQPPHEITIIFSSLIKPIYEIRKKNELENQRLSILRDTLLPKLMSGELKINDINN